MKIRSEQLRSFGEAAIERLGCRLAAHVQRVWPERYEQMGEKAVRTWVRAGEKRARGYGIEDDYDLTRYVDLMVILGERFDTDPQLPWAGEALRDAELTAAEKLGRLLERAKQHLAERGAHAPLARRPPEAAKKL